MECTRKNHASPCFPHTRALALATCQQHIRARALLVHLLRALVPCVFVLLTFKAKQMVSDADLAGTMSEVLTDQENGTRQEEFIGEQMKDTHMAVPPMMREKLADYLYGCSVLGIAAAALYFFVGRVATEFETGMRHLMHTSGLSRIVFWTTMAGLEGFLQLFSETIFGSALGAFFLDLRIVRETSHILLLLSLFTVSWSVVLFACFLCLSIHNQRLTGMVATISVLMFFFTVPMTFNSSGVKAIYLSCPLVPAVHSVWALAMACSHKDGCIALHDMFEIKNVRLSHVVWLDKRYEDMDGREVFAVSLCLTVVQLTAYVLAILTLDLWRYPALTWRAKAASGAQHEADKHKGIALKVQNLVHWYGSVFPWTNKESNSRLRVLNGVSFNIPVASMLGLLGPNGAGKTTIVRCITGEETPREGHVVICPPHSAEPGDSHLQQDGMRQRKRTDRVKSTLIDGDSFLDAYLGLCPQDTILNSDLTVMEHLKLYAGLRSADDPNRAAENCIRGLSLESKRDAVSQQLSGGMKRRLAIGCGLVAHPVVALLDEPTVGLDPVCRREIWEAIQSARDAGGACLLTSHMLDEVEYLCTNVVILAAGRVIAEGSVQHLRDAWSQGYSLNVDARDGEEEIMRQYLLKVLPDGCEKPVKVSKQGQFVYNISKDRDVVGNLFLQLSRESQENGIGHWGISQASFEDVYLQIIGRHTRDASRSLSSSGEV